MNWNRNLLKNKAMPSYVLETEQMLEEAHKISLVEMMKQFEGHRRAGKGLIIDSGLKYNQMGLSPQDMDFKAMLDKMSEFIGACFKVPFVLIVPVQATYNNMNEAKYSLYRDAVLPLAEKLLSLLEKIFKQEFPLIKIKYNEDAISALAIERQTKVDNLIKLVNTGILSRDEARIELGWEERGSEADELFIQQNLIPIEMAGETESQRQVKKNKE